MAAPGKTIFYSLSGGTPNYTVQLINSSKQNKIHNSDGTFSFTDVPAGTYRILATDSLNCTQESEDIIIT
ncbi:MAG: hypothetical protein ACOCVF_01410 [bacterium]